MASSFGFQNGQASSFFIVRYSGRFEFNVVSVRKS